MNCCATLTLFQELIPAYYHVRYQVSGLLHTVTLPSDAISQ